MVNLLINVLIILICIFIYHIFFLNRELEEKYRYFLISAISMVAIYLCIKFPFYDLEGYNIDLRIIPFMVAALYGGRKVGITLLIAVPFICYILEGVEPGFYVTLVQVLSIWIFTFLLSSNFIRFSLSKKLAITLSFLVFFSIINFAISVLFFADLVSNYYLSILFNHFLVLFFTLALTIYLIEYIQKNINIQDEANEAEKLRVISELAASVSHEVRNPLTVTRGFLQLLRDDDISEKKQKEFLDLSLMELDRAQEIINNYLIYAKPSPQNNKEKLAVIEEINYLMKVMTPYGLMSGVEIVAEVIEEGHIIGDRQKFRQSIINIIKNGIEAMPEGGMLVLGAEYTDEKIVVSIKDYGVGMSSQKITQLGLPIFSKKIQGTSLGTMVAFSIIKSMGGTIDVKSEISRGTTFFITFPKINQLVLGE